MKNFYQQSKNFVVKISHSFKNKEIYQNFKKFVHLEQKNEIDF